MYGTLKKIFAFAGSKKGLLKKSLLFSFLSGLFSAMQFAALFVVIGALVSDNRDGKFICISLGIMAVSLIGRIITTYFSTMEQTETGYCMVAEKRIHIGDRLRYIPMGYFNKNSIGNITAIVTTTLGDVENSAARVLVSVLGGFFKMCIRDSLCMIDLQTRRKSLHGFCKIVFCTKQLFIGDHC